MTATTIDPPPVDTSRESLYARMGMLLGLKSALRSEVDLIERLEKGLTVAAVQSLRTRFGLTDAETFELIAPRRTLHRREAAGQPLSAEEADKTVRVARVMARAQQVFGGKPEYAAEWLRTAKSALGDRYCAPNPATAVLEILVHGAVRDPEALTPDHFITLEIPDEVPSRSVDEPGMMGASVTLLRSLWSRCPRDGEPPARRPTSRRASE